MVTLCWAAKGGSGTTVVAAALALSSLRPSLLVDLDGELPAVLGLPEPDRPGIAEWLASDTSADHLAELLIDIGPRTWLLPWRTGLFDRHGGDVDRARRPLGNPRRLAPRLVEPVGLRRHRRRRHPHPARAVDGPRRSLTARDSTVLSLAASSSTKPGSADGRDPRRRTWTWPRTTRRRARPRRTSRGGGQSRPGRARAVDAGLLASRLPRVMTRALRQVVGMTDPDIVRTVCELVADRPGDTTSLVQAEVRRLAPLCSPEQQVRARRPGDGPPARTRRTRLLRPRRVRRRGARQRWTARSGSTVMERCSTSARSASKVSTC